MKLKNILIFASLVGSTLLASCTGSYLDEDRNPNALSPSIFWKSEGDIFKGLTAAYAGLQPTISWAIPFERYIVIDNYRSDELDYRPDVGSWMQLAMYNNESTNSVGRTEWRNLYTSINYCNQCLDHIGDVPEEGNAGIKDIKARGIAEARFLRAFYYYRIFINYGERVPMFLHEIVGTDEEFYPPQVEAGVLKKFIETELSECQSDLPESWDSSMAGRATKYTAAALLGKYYMFIGEEEKAKTEFAKVINSNRYGLMENYGDNFDGLHKNNKESVLEVQFTGFFDGGHYEYNLFTVHLGPDSGCGAYEEAYPSNWLFETMKKDVTADGEYTDRLYQTIIFDDPKSRPFYYDEGASFSDYHQPGSIYWRKYVTYDPSLGDYWDNSGFNVPLIRYADILLLYAECLNNEGNTGEAIRYINQVRNRVNAVPIPDTMTKDEVLKHLQDVERPCELALEGSRWYDLIRWGIIKQALIDHEKPFANNFLETKHIRLAIPHDEFLMNPDWVQNEGYTK